jgi:hypothetical protein
VWEAGVEQQIRATIEGDWRLARIWVELRGVGETEFHAIEMQRAADDAFAAVVPRRWVQPPAVEYVILSVTPEGEEAARFASRAAPYTVPVEGETEETALADRLARHRGNRSALWTAFELTRYGRRIPPPEELLAGGEPDRATQAGSDRFWLLELGYAYRFLGVLYDVHASVGLMRGHFATVLGPDEVAVPVNAPADAEAPGLDYGRAGVTVEMSRTFSFATDLLLGATETGFAAGVGGLLRIGRIAGTRLEVGADVMPESGNVGYLRFAWDTIVDVPMAMTVELNDRPAGEANRAAARMLLDVGWQVDDALRFTGRVGYGARTDGLEGGYVLGLGTSWEF